MKQFTIVIPIHQVSGSTMELLNTAIESVKTQREQTFKLAFIMPKDVFDLHGTEISASCEGLEFQMHVNENSTDYQTQINTFVESFLDTPYFSVLQYDDVVLENYVMNVLAHIDGYPDYDMFVPLTIEVDSDNQFVGFSNETVWSVGSMAEWGVFDLANTLKNNFMNYNICGAVIKGESFIDAGGFKPSLRMFQDYEFLLRVLEQGKKVFVIPKMCYKHTNGRIGSIFDSLVNIPDEEKTFWYNLSKKEYIFDYDREIPYTGK